ncbi:MAG: bifunctional nuclease family protein [Anaerolineales bacterium]
MAEMVEVVIDSVRVSLMSPQRVVLLRQTDVERYLPIWIGPYEAESITVALQEVEMIRPLTHDLLRNVFKAFGGKIVRVEIVSLKEDIFYGNIVVEKDGQTLVIDSRPSDALALAVRARVPILVSQEVMDAAGIVPEKDLRLESAAEPPPASSQPPPPTGEEHLDVFEDFLKKLDDSDGQDKPPTT